MKYNYKRKLLFNLLVCLLLTGCSSQNESFDITTMKKTEGNRMQITVLVKYAVSIHNFETVIEEKFPDVDIVQVGNYTANTALAKEFEARLEHDDLTDIVMTWPLAVGEEYWSDRLIDMSGMTFTSNYKTSMLDDIATQEGNLYFLPGPAEIRALVYNKTLFEENGWRVPNNYDEFLSLCEEIQKTGIRPFQLSLGNDEVLDTAFIGFNYGNAYSKPSDTQWAENYYNHKEGAFLDHFSDSLATFQDLIDHDIYQPEDLELFYQDTQRNLFARKTAIIEDSVLLTKYGNVYENTEDEFALMPFFNKNPANDWARLYMTCYIGLNKHLQDKGNDTKYDRVLEIMDFISTPEGQDALSSDNGAMYSSLKNAQAPDVIEIEDLKNALNQGRYAIFPSLNVNGNALREGLAGMVAKKLSSEDLAMMVDEENKNPSGQDDVVVYGQASDTFSLIDTGSFVSDTMREAIDADIGLFLDNGKDGLYNGKGISAKIYEGDITNIDLQRIFPDLMHGEKGELWKITMNGEDLMNTLEYSMDINDHTGWFYYFSGLKITFNQYAPQGERILSITTTDGSAIENDNIYEIAVMEDSVPSEYVKNCEKTSLLIQNLLKDKILQEGTISPVRDGRFRLKYK